MEEGVNSLLIKFADDTKTGAVATTEEQVLQIQKDLDRLWKWAGDNRMAFNVDKCKACFSLQVEGIYQDKAGSPLILELKRGLASLLQFQTHAGTVTEIFGVLWQPTSKTRYSMEGSLIKSALSEESHTISLILKSSIGANITSRQLLELVTQGPGSNELPQKSLPEALAAVLDKVHPMNITSEPSKRLCTKCPTLKTYLKELHEWLKMDRFKASTTWHFCGVVYMLHGAKKKDILLLLKKAPKDMVPFYIEAAVAAQTKAALAALSEFLDMRNKEQVPLQEKFLYAAAFSPRPSKELLRMVIDLLGGKKLVTSIWETGNLAIGSLIGKLCQMQLCELEEVRLQMERILHKLKSTRSNSERVIYLLSLKNALLPESIPTFLHYAEEGPAPISATALSALQRYPAQHISDTVKAAMKRIFYQVRRKYSNVLRLAAAEILLDNDPSPADFTHVLLVTRELQPEMAQFLLSKIQGILRSPHHPSRQVIKDVLKDPQINNYYFLSSLAGNSISFLGPLAVTNDTLSTFGLKLLFSDIGFLRTSTTSFDVLSHGHQFQAAQVAFEAMGLDSVLAGDTPDEEEGFKAGMSVTLLGVQLRPVVFFDGYTDLMAKVFTSSGKPTSVMKGNVLLMDHQQAVPLQSGLQAVISLQGGLGLDVSADIHVNVWNQELTTDVETRGAMTIDFKAELDAPFFQVTLKSENEIEMATNFYTTATVTSLPVLMCLQVTEERVSHGQYISVSQSSANHDATAHEERRTSMPGRELALHPANAVMCKILLAGQ
ncbi:Microsomal triglyceride transfer protein large subunit [Varanus komodoensis]|nr:Microsomal triglyceride transfer protein large subunit [Varanus komodoensis]